MRINELTKGFEGLRLKPYLCPAGKQTLGFGRNIEDNGITEEEACFMLDSDIARCRERLAIHFPYFSRLNEPRQGVMIDMCFNMGFTRLREFRKMLGAISEGNWQLAADEMIDSRWARQVGNRAQILKQMMITGRWPQG